MRINETHLCYLEKIDSTLKVKFLGLSFEHESLIGELERMSHDQNTSVLDLQILLERSSLSCLLRNFNFCDSLPDPYQGIPPYKRISSDEYQKMIGNKQCEINSQIHRSFQKKDIDPLIVFKTNLKSEFIKQIKSRRIAYMIERGYNRLDSNVQIVAFSHRRVGFTYPEFKLGSDFDVIFKTNFGYGASGYFFTNIRYKGIDILPFSHWVSYRYVNKHDIIRYTRKHKLENEEWESTMSFVAECFNHSVERPKSFVETWIVKECDKMVMGLESILNEEISYTVQDSYFTSSKRSITGPDLIDFKGEKISGAIDLLDRISELKGIANHIDSYLKRILNCNLTIYSQLEKEIIGLQSDVTKISEIIDRIEPEWQMLRKEDDIYLQYKREIRLQMEKDFTKVDQYRLNGLSEQMFSSQYPEYAKFSLKFTPVDKNYRQLQTDRRTKQYWCDRFGVYHETIKKYLDMISYNEVA